MNFAGTSSDFFIGGQLYLGPIQVYFVAGW